MTGGTGPVLAAAAAFVGTHGLLSHPLRAPLVGRLGERGFALLYSLVAAVTLGLTVWTYRRASDTVLLWQPGDVLWAVATVLMLVASILLVGSLRGNPALPGAASRAAEAPARGVYAVTRHPMMWAFALWSLCHVLVFPVAKNCVLCGAIALLALAGAALQDWKKARLDPTGWPAWEARTSYLPFFAIVQGRARGSRFGALALGGGVALWLLATWAHLPLAGWPAGIWRWIR